MIMIAYSASTSTLIFSRYTFPTSFGRAPRDISKHRKGFKASEWMNWLTIFSPIMLKDLSGINDEYYEEWLSMCDAMSLCREWALGDAQIDLIEQKIIRFVEYYEKVHYAFDTAKMSACRATIHYLLHIAQCIRDCGPPGIYWQFPTERMCGFLTQKVKSRVSANRNLSLALLQKEQLRLVQLLYPKISYSVSVQDRESLAEREVEAVPATKLNPILVGINPHRLKSTPEMLSNGISLMHHHWRPPNPTGMSPNEKTRLKEYYLRILQGRRIPDEQCTILYAKQIQRFSHCSFPGFKVSSHSARSSLDTREAFLISYATLDRNAEPNGPCRFGAVLYFTCVNMDERHGDQLLAFIRLLKAGCTRGERFVFNEGEGATEFIRVDSIKTLVSLICKDDKLWFAHRYTSLLLPE